MTARVRTAMTPRMRNGRRLRLTGASAVAGTTTAGAAAVSGAAATGCGRSVIAGVGCGGCADCAALSMSVSLALLVKVDALAAHVGGRFEQERDGDDEKEGDARQDEHPLEGQQHGLAGDHAVEDAAGGGGRGAGIESAGDEPGLNSADPLQHLGAAG